MTAASDVFQGKYILPMRPEEEIQVVRRFFGSRHGYFVEVGANDPQNLSQTFHLEEAGWTGALIEPQPALVAALRRQRKAKVFGVACSSPENSGKTMQLHLAGSHSSFDPRLNVATVATTGAIDVPTRTLDEVLTEADAPVPIDFLSIDVEGHEIEVLRGLGFSHWRPRLILVEDLVMNLRLHHFLRMQGYKWWGRTGLNSWYVPAEAEQRVSWLGQWQFSANIIWRRPFVICARA